MWKTFSHFSSAMRSFVRQDHYIDRDLIVAHLLKGHRSLNLCNVLRTLQSPMGFLRIHRHYHFDNGFTISYNKSATLYYNWIVSHYLNDYDLFFKVQLFKIYFFVWLDFCLISFRKINQDLQDNFWIVFLNQSAIYIIISSLLFQEQIS